MKATKIKPKPRYNRAEYERGVTDGGRAYHAITNKPRTGTRSYLAGFDRGQKIEMDKDVKADYVAMLNASMQPQTERNRNEN